MPHWYLNPSYNTENFIYGVGEGNSLNSAKNNALNDMASRLSVSVQSSISQFKQSINKTNEKDLFEKKIVSNLNIEVDKINFLNSQVLNSESVNGTFYVLIQSDKRALIKEYYKKLKFNDTLITNNSENMSKIDNEKTFKLLKLIPIVEKAISQAIFLSSLDSSFQVDSYFLKYQNIKNSIDALKNNLIIEVSSNYKYKYFADAVKMLLKNTGYKIAKNGENATLKMDINSAILNKRDMAWQNVNVTTSISTIVDNRTIFNSQIKSNGRSSKSKDDAIL